MTEDKRIDDEIKVLKGLKNMVRAYAELSSIKMKSTRSSVLFARKFLGDLGQVFDEVRTSYVEEVNKLFKPKLFGLKRSNKVTFLPHNGKTVAVFLSANSRLYGDLLLQSFELFMNSVRSGAEATILGKIGLSMFREVEKTRPVTYFDFPDVEIDQKTLSDLIRHLVPYNAIKIYYGKYFNEGAPKPSEYILNSEIKLEENNQTKAVKYIFEPTLDDVLKFFEKEIFGNLFEQAIRESQLAKFASRLIAMNKAEANIAETLSVMNKRRLLLTHKNSNIKQLNALSSYYSRFS